MLINQFTIYAFFMCNESCDKDMPELSTEFTEYTDVFSEENARKLLSHESENHAIDLNKNDSSYEFIYSLSTIELRILWKYLNDVLMKS